MKKILLALTLVVIISGGLMLFSGGEETAEIGNAPIGELADDESFNSLTTYQDQVFKILYPNNLYSAEVKGPGNFDSGYLQGLSFATSVDLAPLHFDQHRGERSFISIQPLLEPIDKVMIAVGSNEGGCALPDITFDGIKALRCFEAGPPESNLKVSHYFIPFGEITFMVGWKHPQKDSSAEYSLAEDDFLEIISTLHFFE